MSFGLRLTVAVMAGFVSFSACAAERATPEEMNAIRAHISKFWQIPPTDWNVVIEIQVTVLPDGTVAEAHAINRPPTTDRHWVIAADSARRAVRVASPLPIPRDKYDQFADFVLVFNPKQMLGGR